MTHSHFDHAGGMYEFSDRCVHKAKAAIIARPTASDTVAYTGYVRAETFTALHYEGFSHEHYRVHPAPLTRIVDGGDLIDLGDRVFRGFHLSGHSPGSIALFEEATGTLFSGDLVYDDSLVDDLYHSDPDVLKDSRARLMELQIKTIHAGHFQFFRV